MRFAAKTVTQFALAASLVLPGCVITPELLGTLLKDGGKGLPGSGSGESVVKDFFFPYTATFKAVSKETGKSAFSVGAFSVEETSTSSITDEIDSFGGRDATVKTTTVKDATTRAVGGPVSSKTATTTSRTAYTLNADGTVTFSKPGSSDRYTFTEELFTGAGASFKQDEVTYKLTPIGSESVTAASRSWDAFKFRVEASAASTSIAADGKSTTFKFSLNGSIWAARGAGMIRQDMSGTIDITGAATGSGTASMFRELESLTR